MTKIKGSGKIMVWKGGDLMIRREVVDDLAKVNPVVEVVPILEELLTWQNSLLGDSMDDIVNSTLESVIDIILDNC